MVEAPLYLTKTSKARLEKQLEEVIYELEKVIPGKINEAKALGDLSENDEYQTQKNNQGRLNSVRMEIEYKLKNGVLIEDLDWQDGVVQVGSIVTVKNVAAGLELTYTILGSEDTDVENLIISIDTPVAQAMVGKKVGEIAEVNGQSLEIVKVEKWNL